MKLHPNPPWIEDGRDALGRISKGGRQDLEKARHYIDLLIELRYGDDEGA